MRQLLFLLTVNKTNPQELQLFIKIFNEYTGHYMYIEASSPRKLGDNARLSSPIYSKSTVPSCLKFWYHMYGSTMGTLNVYAVLSGRYQRIWTQSGISSMTSICIIHLLCLYSKDRRSHPTRNPVFGVCDQAILKPVCSVAEAS